MVSVTRRKYLAASVAAFFSALVRGQPRPPTDLRIDGQAQALPLATLTQDAETPEQIALYLPIVGTLGEDYTASVRFRVATVGAWQDAPDLWRIEPEWTAGGVVVAEAFAGTIFGLTSGTSYDVEVTVSNGSTQQVFSDTFTTRAYHRAASGTPVTVTTQAQLQSAINSATPGTVIQIAADTTITITGTQPQISNKSGTASDPIFIRGANRATSKLVRQIGSNSESIFTISNTAHHFVIEDLTLGSYGVDDPGSVWVSTPSANGVIRFNSAAVANNWTFRRLNIVNCNKGIQHDGFYTGHLIHDCVFQGNNRYAREFLEGAAEDLDGVVASVTPSAGGVQALTLLVTNFYGNDRPGRPLRFSTAGNDSARTFAITGKATDGSTTENVTSVPSGGGKESAKIWYELSSITVDNNTAGAITVGWRAVSNNATWNDNGVQLGGTGHCVFNCEFSGFGDTIGFVTGSTTSVNKCCYIYRNKVVNAGDDGIEGEYTHRNIGIYDNLIRNSMTGLSIDGNYGGPIYLFRNRIINCGRQPVKCGDVASGVLIWANTFVKMRGTGAGNAAQEGRNFWHWTSNANMKDWEVRNNLFLWETDETADPQYGNALLFVEAIDAFDPWVLTHNGWGRDGQPLRIGMASGSVATLNGLYSPRFDNDIEITNQAAVFAVPVAFPTNYYEGVSTDYTLELKAGAQGIGRGVVIPTICESGDVGAYGYLEAVPSIGDRTS